MVTQTIIRKIPFNYRTLQKIKANEYQRFFSSLDDYDLYINHLGEIQWMTAEEADAQHEFFLHHEHTTNFLTKFFFTTKTPNLKNVSQAEKEIRLQIRAFLEQSYLGQITSETQKLIPSPWNYEFKKEEILHIPLTIDTLKSRDWKKTVVSISAIILILIAIISPFILKPGEQTGQLLVQSNVKGGRIFMDNHVFLGYTGTIIQKVPIGAHRISVEKKGYKTIPKFHNIEITNDSTQKVHVQLKPLTSQVEGNLKIIADQKDSDLFIDKEYYGKISDFPVLTLDEGQYRIEVSKSGFITLPSEQMVNITAGDTTILIIEQFSASTQTSSKSAMPSTGSLGITSNISGAQIYLNGKYTGKETDYVFTNMPFGKYKVELVKGGYNIEPQEKTVFITSSDPLGEALFKLKQQFESVTIEADHPDAQIFIDGDPKGTGKIQTDLTIGKHEISFGKIDGFNAPLVNEINVKPRLPLHIKVKYFPRMKIVAEVTNNGNIRTKDCEIITGFTFSNKGFSPSDEAGPEVIYLEDIKNYFWKLGFAFPLRNPKGNDAIQMTFKLPHELNYDQKFTLKIDAATSEDKYPLSLSRKTDISIKFNNNILSYYYQPKILEKIGQTNPSEWDITSFIKPGSNLLEIATTEKNNTYYFVKKIEVYN